MLIRMKEEKEEGNRNSIVRKVMKDIYSSVFKKISEEQKNEGMTVNDRHRYTSEENDDENISFIQNNVKAEVKHSLSVDTHSNLAGESEEGEDVKGNTEREGEDGQNRTNEIIDSSEQLKTTHLNNSSEDSYEMGSVSLNIDESKSANETEGDQKQPDDERMQEVRNYFSLIVPEPEEFIAATCYDSPKKASFRLPPPVVRKALVNTRRNSDANIALTPGLYPPHVVKETPMTYRRKSFHDDATTIGPFTCPIVKRTHIAFRGDDDDDEDSHPGPLLSPIVKGTYVNYRTNKIVHTPWPSPHPNVEKTPMTYRSTDDDEIALTPRPVHTTLPIAASVHPFLDHSSDTTGKILEEIGAHAVTLLSGMTLFEQEAFEAACIEMNEVDDDCIKEHFHVADSVVTVSLDVEVSVEEEGYVKDPNEAKNEEEEVEDSWKFIRGIVEGGVRVDSGDEEKKSAVLPTTVEHSIRLSDQVNESTGLDLNATNEGQELPAEIKGSTIEKEKGEIIDFHFLRFTDRSDDDEMMCSKQDVQTKRESLKNVPQEGTVDSSFLKMYEELSSFEERCTSLDNEMNMTHTASDYHVITVADNYDISLADDDSTEYEDTVAFASPHGTLNYEISGHLVGDNQDLIEHGAKDDKSMGILLRNLSPIPIVSDEGDIFVADIEIVSEGDACLNKALNDGDGIIYNEAKEGDYHSEEDNVEGCMNKALNDGNKIVDKEAKKVVNHGDIEDEGENEVARVDNDELLNPMIELGQSKCEISETGSNDIKVGGIIEKEKGGDVSVHFLSSTDRSDDDEMMCSKQDFNKTCNKYTAIEDKGDRYRMIISELDEEMKSKRENKGKEVKAKGSKGYEKEEVIPGTIAQCDAVLKEPDDVCSTQESCRSTELGDVLLRPLALSCCTCCPEWDSLLPPSPMPPSPMPPSPSSCCIPLCFGSIYSDPSTGTRSP